MILCFGIYLEGINGGSSRTKYFGFLPVDLGVECQLSEVGNFRFGSQAVSRVLRSSHWRGLAL